MNKDLTVGKPSKVLVSFTIPLFISVIFQQLYNMADSIIAGRYANGLAAVGASYPITMLFMSVALGCQIGCSVVIGRNFGSGDHRRTKICITTSLTAGLVLSAVLTAVGIIFSPALMKLVNTPESCFEDGNTYLEIYTCGFIFLFLYNVATGIFNSLGDSKTPLYLLIGSSLGNIFLDALFVIVFKWGVPGVAWATFIAQGVACVLALIILFKRVRMLCPNEKTPLFEMSALKEITIISIPSILQQGFISIGNMFIQYLVNSFGDVVLEGYSAAIKLNTFAIVSFTTLGNGMSSFTAQNDGAGKPDRIKSGLKTAVITGLSIAALFFVCFFFFTESFIGLFMNEESTEEAIASGMEFMHIVTPAYFFICIKLVCDGVLRGSEKMILFMISTFVDLVLRVVLAFVLSGSMGAAGIWTAWPGSWVVGSVMSLIFALNVIKKKNRVKQSEARG